MISILDTDVYKFSVSYAYMKLFPNAIGTFEFKDRSNTPRTKEFLEKYIEELDSMSEVSLTDEEFYLCCKNIRYIPKCYWEWLRSFRFESNAYYAYLDADKVLHVYVTDFLYKATLWEIPCLYSVTEVENLEKKIDWKLVGTNLAKKIEIANNCELKFSEFGTRRRFNYIVQRKVVEELFKKAKTFVGTSNVHFAMQYNSKPIGTHPHEWFMFHGAIYGYKQANYLALENWVNVYDGDLGIALTDTYSRYTFFNQMSLKQAKLFDGLRQDSGGEFDFIDDAIDFYKNKNVDYYSKTLVFSNALTFSKALQIKKYCDSCGVKSSFGIGTNLTNDCGYPAENIVMKLVSCCISPNNPTRNCVKLSDDVGKEQGLDKEIKIAKHELGL